MSTPVASTGFFPTLPRSTTLTRQAPGTRQASRPRGTTQTCNTPRPHNAAWASQAGSLRGRHTVEDPLRQPDAPLRVVSPRAALGSDHDLLFPHHDTNFLELPTLIQASNREKDEENTQRGQDFPRQGGEPCASSY